MPQPIDLRRRPRLSYLSRGRGAKPGPRPDWIMGQVWCLHWYGYHGSVTINSRRLDFAPGELTVTPPFAVVHFDHGPDPGAIASIQWVGTRDWEARWWLPDLVPAAQAEPVIARLQPCLDDFRDDRRRIEIRLWDALGDLATTTQPEDQGQDALVLHAQQIVDEHLAAGLNAEELARRVDLSPSQLNRRFVAATGLSVGRWIARRRGSQALHLLQETRMPIKDIAVRVGVPDQQHFNKFIRRLYGQAPSALRGGAAVTRCRTG